MTRPSAYTREWDGAGFSIRRSRTGWVLAHWSRVQGEITGDVYLRPYDDVFPVTVDMADHECAAMKLWRERAGYRRLKIGYKVGT